MNIFSFINKNKWIIALGLLIIIVTFLRGWHLEEYALWRADQARDAYLLKDIADNDFGYFKLLGPKAGAAVSVDGVKGAFKLGPIYNYLQYLGIFLFGKVTATSLLFVDWILSILSIITFYFFIRYFFCRKNSFIITILFSFSYILTLYSRFAWNINQIIFWELLSSLSFLRFLNYLKKASSKEGYINKKLGKIWFFVFVFALGVVGQLHILSAIAFVALYGIMLIIYRPTIHWKTLLSGILVLLFMYSPMIISDVYNKGDNLQRLLLATKKEKKSEWTLSKKMQKISSYHGKNYLLILSGINKYDYKKASLIGIYFIILSVGLMLLILFKEKLSLKYFSKKKYYHNIFILNRQQKQFLILILGWFFIFGLVYWRILPRLHKERYWLLISPLPFIFLGMWFYLIDQIAKIKYKFFNEKSNIGMILVLFITSLILFSNLQAILLFYKSLEIGTIQSNKVHHKTVLGPYRFLTGYGEMKNIIDYFAQNRKNTNSAICFKSLEYQNKLGFEYLLDYYYPNIKYIQTSEGGKYNCDFYVITKLSREKRELKDFINKYIIKDGKEFKTLAIWKLELKNIPSSKQEVAKKQAIRKLDKRVIYWRDLFNK